MSQNEPARLLRIGIAEYKRVFDIHGRSNRTQFWTFAIINIGLAQAMVSLIIFLFLVLHQPSEFGNGGDPLSFKMIFLGIIASYLIILPPYFSALVRRLHDIGKSGFWALPQLVFLTVGLALMARLVFGDIVNEDSHLFLFFNNLCHLVYCLVILVLAIRPSVEGPNQYGDQPISSS
jgi:uncharacterized membrane protein YhaH (DUF805 family)